MEAESFSSTLKAWESTTKTIPTTPVGTRGGSSITPMRAKPTPTAHTNGTAKASKPTLPSSQRPGTFVKPQPSSRTIPLAVSPTTTPTTKGGELASAIEELKKLVGVEYVRLDSDTIQQLSKSTVPDRTTPVASVLPSSVEQVQGVLRICSRYGIPVHPISTGHNWGYSDTCAPTDGQLILDLHRMNRIIEVNAELAYAVVEPGVTQGQLGEYLRANGVPLMVDCTGAGPDTSMIGNTMERGLGHSPNGDRFANCCAMEVVLADGRLLKTGFARFEGAEVAHLHKQGVGPSIDGLFTQSNFGVVTRMTIWLVPKPEKISMYGIFLPSPESIGPAIDALRPLRLNGTIRSLLHIANDLRLVSVSESYPWEEMNGKTPLSPEIRQKLIARNGISAWAGAGGLYGTIEEVEAAKKTIAKVLAALPFAPRVIFVDDVQMEAATKGTNFLAQGSTPSSGQLPSSSSPSFEEKPSTNGIAVPGPSPQEAAMMVLLQKLRFQYDLLTGTPPQSSVQGALWRAKRMDSPKSVSTNPLDHDAGIVWVAPTMPMTGRHVLKLNSIAESIMNKHGFDYLCTLNMATQRAICAVITIAFDRLDKDDTARASRCHEELLSAFLREGFIPYRMGNALVEKVGGGEGDNFFEVMSQIKKALDPTGILSPGHYLPPTKK